MAEAVLIRAGGGISKAFMVSDTAPTNPKLIWIDSGNSYIAKFYDTDTSTWIAIKTAWA